MRWLLLIGILAAGTFAVASGASDASPSRTVHVTLGDSLVETDTATVAAGDVTFATRNSGSTQHELQVVRTDAAPGELPVGLDGVFYEKAGELVLGEPHGHAAHGAKASGSEAGSRFAPPSRHVEPGGERADTVRLTLGRYVLFCNLPGHYAAGQRTGLTVR